MKFVLADIRNKKICGLYGGRNEKYGDIWNYVGSADFNNCGYKFDKIEDAIRVKNSLNETGLICPNFEIIVVDETVCGKWVQGNNYLQFVCSVCHKGIMQNPEQPYCSECGAKIDGKSEATDEN